ncbi:MAG: ribose/xylose/arabinose/galactoside ABC-type transport system permease subunit [Ilumatobacter sp.]|jgi:ribose/xylose/arabinose/galactoside ABC-type transport system permease subunit
MNGLRRILAGEQMRVFLPLILAVVGLAWYTEYHRDNFVGWTNLENILLQTSVLGIVAVGQTFLIAAGELDLSVGTFAGFSAVLAATQVVDGRSEFLSITVVLIVGALVGLMWGVVVTSLRVPSFILTLGGLSVFQSLALVRAKNSPVPVRGFFEWLRTGDLFGLRTPIVLLIVVTVVASLVLRYTRFGRQLYATGSSEEVAYLAGLPTARVKIFAYMISSVLAAVGGLVLMARIGSGDPRSGGGLELRAIAAVVLGGASLAGGRGTAIGTVLGVFVLGVVQAALTFLDVNDSWSDFVFGSVLIIAVLLTAITDLKRNSSSRPNMLTSLFRRRPAAETRTSSATPSSEI